MTNNTLRNVSERLVLGRIAHRTLHLLQRLLLMLGALILLSMSLPAGAATTAVTLSAPANNSVFTAPATLTLRATASAATGYTVQKVEFFHSATNLIGSDTTKAYRVSWANVAPGAYSVTARVTAVRANNPNQVVTSSPITVIVNSPPTATLTSPANNAVFVAGSTIPLSATAADSDGSISRVEFFNGNTRIGTDTSTPYSIDWTNVARGSYTLTARATDNRNATTISAPIHITVNSAPRVSLTSPADNAVFTAPGNITFRANAADADGGISKVEFYNGATLIGADTTTRYSFTWTAVSAGVYSITAKATDNLGLTTTSTPITVRVNSPPTVALTSPANNAVFVRGSTILLAATATDDGSISKVEFFNGNTRIATSTTAPYSFNWSNAAPGAHTLTAKATDNLGAATTSAAITVSVTRAPTISLTSPANNAVFTAPASIALAATATDDGSVSKVEFYNGTTLIATDTTAPYSFNWTNVAAGTYIITAKATDNLGVQTTSAARSVTVNPGVNLPPTVALTSPVNNAVFVSGTVIALTATATDDGSVAKVEFFDGAKLIGTLTTAPYTFNWSNAPAGARNITAKATDNLGIATTSAAITINVTAAPTVVITSPAHNASYAAPAAIALTVTATDDGSVAKVEFFNGATLIGTVTTAPYTFNWTNVAAGAYSITAKATDNMGIATTSAAITINVASAPTITLTSPLNNATYTAPASIPLAAAAAGNVTQVDFYNGVTLIGTVTTAPYNATWAAVPAGSYTLTAKATDNLGISTTSAPITVTVQPAAPVGMYFIHPDHLNTPRLITNQAGTVVWRWDNDDPFGNNAPNENPSGVGAFTCNLRLPGQYFDRETNLHYNYFRDYDPAIGRYPQSDPIGLRGGINTYGYAAQNPLSHTDPLGLAVWICNRAVQGFPGVGNHAYLWNDKTQRSCSMRGSSGRGLPSDKEKGPGPGGDQCVEIPGSPGKEDQIMNCCAKDANNGIWFPVVNDCHTANQDCVKRAGLKSPSVPGGRMGPCDSCAPRPTGTTFHGAP